MLWKEPWGSVRDVSLSSLIPFHKQRKDMITSEIKDSALYQENPLYHQANPMDPTLDHTGCNIKNVNFKGAKGGDSALEWSLKLDSERKSKILQKIRKNLARASCADSSSRAEPDGKICKGKFGTPPRKGKSLEGGQKSVMAAVCAKLEKLGGAKYEKKNYQFLNRIKTIYNMKEKKLPTHRDFLKTFDRVMSSKRIKSLSKLKNQTDVTAASVLNTNPSIVLPKISSVDKKPTANPEKQTKINPKITVNDDENMSVGSAQ